MIFKKFIVSGALAVSLSTVHWVSLFDFSSPHNGLKEQSSEKQKIDPPKPTVTISDKELTHLLGFEYIEPINELSSDESLGSNQILLSSVAVTVNAISIVDDRYIVYITYTPPNSEELSQKLTKGDELLGFTLINISQNELLFKNQDSEVRYKIFKRKNKA